ncbi:MAG: outer membrane beta-barrel domain-containing protein [Bdellovibrionales bacterium]
MSRILLLLILGFAALGHAEEIKFSKEELARESVLPVFKTRKTVLNRNVSLTKRISVAAGAGFVMNEPLNSSIQYGGLINYHLDEVRGVQARFYIWNQGDSSYTEQLDAGAGRTLGLKNRPRPQYLATANYQYSIFYGKISMGKKIVTNMSLYGLAGLGMINIGGSMYPMADLGLGMKFYFNRNIALRLDLVSMIYNGPNILSKSGTIAPNEPVDSFETTVSLNNVLGVGLEFLFK